MSSIFSWWWTLNYYWFKSKIAEEEKGDEHGNAHVSLKSAYSDGDIEALIDHLLEQMDKDDNGYVTYAEYKLYS